LIEDYFVDNSQLYAKVLMDKKSQFLRSIVVNKGSKNDVRVGMIVYDDIYLIGRVVEVNYLTSRVLLISDINSKVPVTILPLNIEAIMSGFGRQNGRLQYIQVEKLNNKDNEELIVVTSGSGEVFKSGIPIGKINSIETQVNNEIIVNFYRDFSQLKYVKIESHIKENLNIDQNNKKNFEVSNKKISQLNSQARNIDILKKQKIINAEIQLKLQLENIRLKNNLIDTQRELEKKNKKIEENNTKNKHLEFLELNLLYGHKCRKTLFKSKLFNVGTIEYKNCVLNKGPFIRGN